MFPEKIKNKILFEIEEIDDLLKSFSILLKKAEFKTIDHIETAALAHIMHSYYNGIENIFIHILKGENSSLNISGTSWHKLVLEQVNQINGKALFSDKVYNELKEFLAFRHLVRHMYSTHLEIGKINNLALKIYPLWTEVKVAVNLLIKA